MKPKSIVGWVALILVLGFALYRARFAPVPVITHTVANGPVTAEVMGTGTLDARLKATLSPKIQGRLAEVLVDQGDGISRGQVLARLDDGELRQQVEVADATLAAVQATVERVRADRLRAAAVLTQAQLDHQRALDLVASQVASQSDLDQATERLAIARADVTRSEAAIVEAQKQAIAAERNLAYQRERLADTRLLSPFDGLVVRRDRDPGDVAVPGSAVLRLISTNELWVSAWVDETELGALAAGQPARTVFRSQPDQVYPGHVARIGLLADSETRELLVDVALDQLPSLWALGQRVEVYLQTAAKPDVILLPEAFVARRSRQPGVYLAADGRITWKPVTLGLRGRDQVEVTAGLAAGNLVLRAPEGRRHELPEGRRVKVP
jgi:HlyD family secretion protein